MRRSLSLSLGKVAAPVASVVLVASAAYGAVTLTYNTPSTQSIGLQAPPIVWVAGPDSSGNSYVSSFALSSNATYYAVTLRAVPEANVTWGNFTTLRNQDASAYTVTVTGTSVAASAKVLDFRMEFRSHGTDALVGTLNLRDASPSASLGSVASGAQLYTKVYLKLDTGTGLADLPGAVTVSLTVGG